LSRYPLNQPLRLSTTVRDVNGALVNASALTLVVKLAQADGTWLTTGTYASPVNDGTGLYHQDIPVTDLTGMGHYQYTWTATGTGAGVSFGDFDVFDPYEQAILPLQDAKDTLDIPQSNTSADTEIQAYVATIQSSLEAFLGGPAINRTITERAEAVAGMTRICLRQRPLVSVTSITAESSGAAVSITDVKIDANAGIIQRSTGWPFYGPLFMSLPWFNVIYVAGWGTQAPAAFNRFAALVLQNLWESQHGPSARPSIGGVEMVQPPGFSFAIPNRAAELLNGSLNGMPFRLEAFV